MGNWVAGRALSRLEGLASNPKDWSEMVALGALNATTSFTTQEPTNCDNQSYVKLSENPMFHDRSKHIQIIYHYVWDMV